MIIAICGGDATGKQTQSTLLAERMRATRFAFPNYESETGKAILGHLKRDWCAAQIDKETGAVTQHVVRDRYLDDLIFQSLQTVNRLERLPEIRAAMKLGPVVFDRYWQSAVVYSGLDGLDHNWLRHVQQDPMPPANVNILLDAPVAEGFTRRPDRRDRIESDRPYLEKVRIRYLELWDEHRRDGGWYTINAVGSVNEVSERIDQVLRAHL